MEKYQTHIDSLDNFKELYKHSIKNPTEFFGEQAKKLLNWQKDFEIVQYGSFVEGNTSWFLGGELNACYNCVDRHAFKNPKKIAVIYEGDDDNDDFSLTYEQLLNEICKVAGVLKDWGVNKGDVVSIYMPMNVYTFIAVLAIVRLGAVHSVIFAGFSSGSVKDRINDSHCKILITCDEGMRGGKLINIKELCDKAIVDCKKIEKILVLNRSKKNIFYFKNDKEFYWKEETIKYPGYIPPVPVNSEDPLFLLYTSGSTGTPKGVVHSTAGYLLGAALSTKYVFNIHDNDILFTTGDVGWITGHTYALYGPLLLGITSIVFEGTPTYPDCGKLWRIVEKHKVTHFYIAPTALKLLKKLGEDQIDKYDLSSLKVLGSVGEPISPNIWNWYNEKIGKKRCYITDTYWQTESGSHLIAPIAGVIKNKPGSASLPFFGIEAAIVDINTKKEILEQEAEGLLVIKKSWPSIARTIWKNHEKFLETYFNECNGYYFTGDGAIRDKDGYYWITGRVDDVLNVSGHRISTSEIESVVQKLSLVYDSAAIGIKDDIKGQSVLVFAAVKNYKENDCQNENVTFNNVLNTQIINLVRNEIGAFAAPKLAIIVSELPKTRSGKTLRRILKKISSNECDDLGDISTLVNPDVVTNIIRDFKFQFK